MKIVIIDGQGGRIGSLLATRIHREQIPNAKIYAIGTNSAATAAMMKGGADFGATGENPVLVACRDSRKVEVYEVDSKDGSLESAGSGLMLENDSPSCLVIAE